MEWLVVLAQIGRIQKCLRRWQGKVGHRWCGAGSGRHTENGHGERLSRSESSPDVMGRKVH